eukprot:TRINITY_DN11681_c0_g1_i1.p1 TRINITY_DN11681_c0_g1~~TRINITY_DN11681_c0_g1_i1.p1  ORF type:complete len:253 (-),score=76.69 TRINITY_DN11681_c0_g1_i1:128-886(-)
MCIRDRPCIVQVGDVLWLGSAMPGAPAIGCLVGIAFAAFGFVSLSGGLQIDSLSWALIYLGAMATECLVTKKIVSHIQLEPWGLVLYNNLLALCLMPFTFIQEPQAMDYATWVPELMESSAYIPVIVSCGMGLTISFFGLNARKGLSATSFMVLGVVNKLASVILNFFLWEHHAPPAALACLAVCIGLGVLYSQVNSKPAAPPAEEAIRSEEKVPLSEVVGTHDLQEDSEEECSMDLIEMLVGDEEAAEKNE